MNAPRHVVLSIDYEIFGNGTGDVRQHVVDPTERMLKLGDEFGTPFTIFFETEEYLSFVRYREALRRDLGYDPAQLMHDQAVDLVRRGHDLQLHLHPQWVGARYENGQWSLNASKRAVDDLFEQQPDVTKYMAERKAVLDEMLAQAEPGRTVRAYRAGAFCAQPGDRLLTALAAHGFLIESSVVKGLHRDRGYGRYDFRNVPSRKRAWRIRRDVCVEDAAGCLLELPIHSVMQRRWHQFTLSRLKAKFSGNVPRAQQKEMIEQLGLRWNPVSLLQFLFRPVPVKLDCHNLSPGKLHDWIRSAERSPLDPLDVVVVIGHSKEHIDDDAMRRFLKKLAGDKELKVVTFDQIAKMLVSIGR